MKTLIFFATIAFHSLNSKSQTLQREAQHINAIVPRVEMLNFFQLERNYLPFTYIKADYIKGKATITDDWAKGNIVLKNEDVIYANVDLTYNQVLDKLFVKANKGVIVLLKKPIKEFSIADGNNMIYFRTGFPSVNNNNDDTIYEVLKDGEFKLLKRVEKKIYITVGYNIVTEKRYDSTVKYFVNEGNKMYEIMPNLRSIQEAVSKHGLPIDNLINSCTIKNESQLVALIKKLP